MKRWLILSLVGCVVLGSVASAAVQMGDTELDVMGAWMKQNGKGDGEDFSTYLLSAGIGYFITDNVQVGGAALGMRVKNGDTQKYWGIGARGKYHFMPTNQWVPYIGGQLFWVKADDGDERDDSGTLWGPLAGLRYELNAYNDFFVEYQYHRWDGNIGKELRDGHALFAGIVHQFK